MSDIRRLVIQLVLLLVALFTLYLLVVFLPMPQMRSDARLPVNQSAPGPVPTPESMAAVRKPQSFQHFVSITERGFEPSELSIKEGETVRFTNNTQGSVRLVGADAPFSSSERIARGEYAEVLFAQAGEYPYADTGTKRAGTIHVQ